VAQYAAAPREPEKRRLLLASRVFGTNGQPWMWRQVVGFSEFETHLWCWDRQNPLEYPAERVAVRVIPGRMAPYEGPGRWMYRLRNLPGGNFYGAHGVERRQLASMMANLRPAVLLCYFADVAMRLLPAAQDTAIPVVAYLHGDFEFLNNRWHRWSLAHVAREFAAVVVINQIERNWLLQHGVREENVHVIPCGAPTELFLPRRHGPTDKVRFVMTSRLSPAKGCEWSIRAFAQVVRNMPEVELHVYGDGPLRDDLRNLVSELGIAKSVAFHGWTGERQLAEVLPQYDIFLQHSLDKEGFGVSIAEAAACELPVVVTCVGGIAEHVVPGETGICVQEKDVAGMAAAMAELAKSPELRRKIGQAGRERMVRYFDATILTRKLQRVLQNVVASAPAASSRTQ
jgi:glycosyltransferase involved in cell wall biosynthesis